MLSFEACKGGSWRLFLRGEGVGFSFKDGDFVKLSFTLPLDVERGGLTKGRDRGDIGGNFREVRLSVVSSMLALFTWQLLAITGVPNLSSGNIGPNIQELTEIKIVPVVNLCDYVCNQQ